MMVVALVNGILAYFGLPLVHGALPHSPLHVRAMADVEDRVSQGHVYLKSVLLRCRDTVLVFYTTKYTTECFFKDSFNYELKSNCLIWPIR